MGTERENTSVQDEDRGMFEAALRDGTPHDDLASAPEPAPDGTDEGGEGTDADITAEPDEGEGAVSTESTGDDTRKGRSPRVPLARLQQECVLKMGER